MASATLIAEIKRLSASEQAEVIQFALGLAKDRPLTARELTNLAQRMVESTDPAEVERLKTVIGQGFYGSTANS